MPDPPGPTRRTPPSRCPQAWHRTHRVHPPRCPPPSVKTLTPMTGRRQMRHGVVARQCRRRAFLEPVGRVEHERAGHATHPREVPIRRSPSAAGRHLPRCGGDQPAARPDRRARAADAALAAAPDRVPGGMPPALRRRLQRALPRLPDADGDGLEPRGDPRAVLRAAATGCRPGARCRCGRSWARARCCCSRAPSTSRAGGVMLPPFHGERMRAYEPIVREAAEREVARWPTDRSFAVHPAHAGGHARGDPARGVRRRRRRAPRAAARAARPTCSGPRRPPGLQFSVLLSRRLGGPDPLAPPRGAHGRDRRALLVGDRRAPGRRRTRRRHATTSARCWSRRASRTAAGWRTRDPRPADDAAARRPRDDGDRAGVDARPAHAPPRRPRAPARRGSTTGGDAYLRAVIAESLRLRPVVPLAGRRLTSELRADGIGPARRHRRHAGDLAGAHAPASPIPSPTRSVPSASSTARRQPTRGSRSAAACAAAWAPPSPRWRCASCSRRSCATARRVPGQPGAPSASRGAT